MSVAHNGRGDFIIEFQKINLAGFFHNNGGEAKTPPGQLLMWYDDYAAPPGGELEESESPIIGAWREFFLRRQMNTWAVGESATRCVWRSREPPDRLSRLNIMVSTSVWILGWIDFHCLRIIAEINLESGRSAAEAVRQGQY